MIEVRNLAKTSDSCPAQWVGEVGEQGGVYIRYRRGTLGVYHSPENRDASLGALVFERQLGSKYEGELDTEIMKELTSFVCRFPE
jgi:hypothetical protein